MNITITELTKRQYMKYIFLLLNILFSFACYAQQTNDSITIVKLLKEDYATMMPPNITAHKANITNDYLLVEKGEVWNIETELDSIYRNNTGASFTREDLFTIRTVKISGDMAYAVWHLVSEFKSKDSVKTVSWNESGVFRKEEGRWKIALIHSSIE